MVKLTKLSVAADADALRLIHGLRVSFTISFTHHPKLTIPTDTIGSENRDVWMRHHAITNLYWLKMQMSNTTKI